MPAKSKPEIIECHTTQAVALPPSCSASKLTRTQRELLTALQTGVTCFYMPYRGRFNPSAYYFRSDTHARCTAAARVLLERDLAESFDRNPYSGEHRLRIKTPNETGVPAAAGGTETKQKP